MRAREFNFDGLVGPSHNYAGLSFGNVASFSNVKSASNPKLAALQGRLLARALDWLKPDGQLIYATCSMEREEGEDIVAASGFAVDPVTADELPAGISPDENGYVRILPKPGLDGFFIARLKRR